MWITLHTAVLLKGELYEFFPIGIQIEQVQNLHGKLFLILYQKLCTWWLMLHNASWSQ